MIGVWWRLRVFLPYPSADNVVGNPLPILICSGKPLLLGGKVLGLVSRETAVVFCDGSPFLEGFDVRDDVPLGCGRHSSPSGNLTRSTISRFWALLIPAEYSP